MSPAHRSSAPDPIFNAIVQNDMQATKSCKIEGCDTRFAGRVRIDGEIVPVCTSHLAAATDASAAAVNRATGNGFGRAEGGQG